MSENETNLIFSLRTALHNLCDANQLSNEAIDTLLPLIILLLPWLEEARKEALQRALGGLRFRGFTVKDVRFRMVADKQAVIERIGEAAPELLPLCLKSELVGVKELQRRLGKDRFDEIVAPYLGAYHQYKFVQEAGGE